MTPGAGRTLRTACPLDCPDGCSLAVVVDDAGRLVSVDAAPPDPDDPTLNALTAGFICRKVKGHAERVYTPERVMTPLVRTGPKGSGRFREATWDEALDLVADRLRATIAEHGPGAVAPYLYTSSGGALASDALVPLLWEVLGTAEVAETICAAAAGEAWDLTFGDMPSAHPLSIVDARLVVLWGANPAVSNTHLPPLVAEAKRRGATVVVVDPRRTATAKRADLHLAVRPGTDVALALAVAASMEAQGLLANEFLADHATGVDEHLATAREWTPERAADVCGIPVEQIVDLAHLLGATRPAFVRVGWGLERTRNGGSAVRAVLALPVLAGQFGVPGTGVLLSTTHTPFWDSSPLRDAVLGPERTDAPRRQINMNRIGAVLAGTDPDEAPVHLLFVQGSNPAATAPNQALVHRGLSREDLFCVVHEQVMTDTARLADVVLPATTHFEADDVAVAYGTFVAQPVVAVIDRVGASRTNAEVAAGLAVRLGHDATTWDPDPARVLGLVTRGGALTAVSTLDPEAAVPFRDVWPTHPDHPGDRRARLATSAAPDAVASYREIDSDLPLTLITPASPRTINTMLGEWNPVDGSVHVHPDDAAARGIADGQAVRVWNELAVLEVTATVDPDLRPGVAAMAKGAWCRDSVGGLTANALVPDTLSDLAGGACFNDARVEIAPLGT